MGKEKCKAKHKQSASNKIDIEIYLIKNHGIPTQAACGGKKRCLEEAKMCQIIVW